MMLNRGGTSLFACFTLALVLIAGAGPAMAEAPAPGADPLTTVKSAIDRTIVVFKEKQIDPASRQKRLRAIAEANFDFAEMARSACGRHWRDFSPEQKDEFVPLFTSFIEDIYLDRIETYSVQKVNDQIEGAKIDFTRQVVDPDGYAEVFSTVALADRANPIQVTYLMRRDGNQWRIYDLTLDAISVIANYRNQFNRVLNNQGYPTLVATMRSKERALAASLAKD